MHNFEFVTKYDGRSDKFLSWQQATGHDGILTTDRTTALQKLRPKGRGIQLREIKNPLNSFTAGERAGIGLAEVAGTGHLVRHILTGVFSTH
jgi:hypothetical protein